jgi:(2R)-ethylmalonyl-CoA mutase
VVGVNEFTESAPSPLTAEGADAFLALDPRAEEQQIARLLAWREARDGEAVKKALAGLTNAAAEGRNVMEPSIACAHAGVTTGEWGEALREIFGEYRAPTGVSGVRLSEAIGNSPLAGRYNELREEVTSAEKRLGRPLTILVGKPGLDGHSNGAEQIAVTATECGMTVIYDGIRLTPEQIVERAKSEKAHLVGLSVLSGSHLGLALDVIARMKAAGLSDIPVVVGGIIPEDDAARLIEAGIAKVFTPKDYEMAGIMDDMIALAAPGRDEAAE